MDLKFNIHARIDKPIAEVFDAVYNPKKLSGYFTTNGASAPLDAGAEVLWDFHDFPGAFPVKVLQSIRNQRIVLEWANVERGVTQVEMTFEAIDANSTLVRISESGWKKQAQASLDESYSHCEGWMQMLCCLKVYVEYGKNLRESFYSQV